LPYVVAPERAARPPPSDIAAAPAIATTIPSTVSREIRSPRRRPAPSATKIGWLWTSVTLAATLVCSRLSNQAAKWTASATPATMAPARSRRDSRAKAARWRIPARGATSAVVKRTR
jgi:hypothetical protein